MWTYLSRRLLYAAPGVLFAACGSDLTLPGDGASPPIDDDSPASLAVFAGNNQEARVGKKLDDPLVVLLTDASANPVPGVSVSFAFRGSVEDAEFDPGTATTDEEGFASVEVKLGSTSGLHTVEAHVAEPASLVATFRVTALPKGGRGRGGGGDDDEGDDD